MPNHKIILSPEQITTIERCAGRGLTVEDMAAIIGVSESTLERRIRDDEAVQAAYSKGRAEAKLFVVNKLFEQIADGKIAAIIFYLKTQCGWREKEEAIANHAEVSFYLPEKAKPSDMG